MYLFILSLFGKVCQQSTCTLSQIVFEVIWLMTLVNNDLFKTIKWFIYILSSLLEMF